MRSHVRANPRRSARRNEADPAHAEGGRRRGVEGSGGAGRHSRPSFRAAVPKEREFGYVASVVSKLRLKVLNQIDSRLEKL